MHDDFLDDLMQIKRENRNACLFQMKNEKMEHEDKDELIASLDKKAEENKYFNLITWLREHPKVSCEEMCNFSEEQLDYLANIIDEKVVSHKRGRRTKITTKGELFITFTYYSVYSPIKVVASIFSICSSTFHDIVKKVTNYYFPVFIKAFVPSKYVKCNKEFENFPDAIGAVDSTTVPFYCPEDKDEKKATWDGKNHVNGHKLQALVNPAGQAIHLNADYHASVHDKKLFDVSGIIEFITAKRGKQTLIYPILADKGYIGIEKYVSTAIIMKKGDQSKDFNDALASDRTIVERYFGRLKMSWSVLHIGYRGDREGLKNVILGLAALTNYLIDQSPLSENDNKTDSIEFSDIHKKRVQIPKKCISKKLSSFLPKNENNWSLPVSFKFVGIRNQGLTCHLNTTLQFLFSIPEYCSLILKGKEIMISPLHELSKLFEILSSPQIYAEKYVASTVELTNMIGPKYLKAQDLRDTLTEMIGFVDANIKAFPDIAFSMYEMYTVNFGNTIFKHGMFHIISNEAGFEDQIKSKITSFSEGQRAFGKLLIAEIYRPEESESYKQHMTRVEFPLELDLTELSSNENKIFHLVEVMAYSSFHFILFKKVDGQWYSINDDWCYECTEEQILALKGGDECDILWNHTSTYKWTARILVFAVEGYHIK